MRNRKIGRLFIFVCLIVLSIPLMGILIVHAQSGPITTAPITPMVDLVTRIGIVAGVISAALQGLKKFAPSIGGWYAVGINLVLSLAVSYAAAPTLDLQFFIAAIGTALAAAGIHSFLRPAGTTSTSSPTAVGQGS